MSNLILNLLICRCICVPWCNRIKRNNWPTHVVSCRSSLGYCHLALFLNVKIKYFSCCSLENRLSHLYSTKRTYWSDIYHITRRKKGSHLWTIFRSRTVLSDRFLLPGKDQTFTTLIYSSFEHNQEKLASLVPSIFRFTSSDACHSIQGVNCPGNNIGTLCFLSCQDRIHHDSCACI